MLLYVSMYVLFIMYVLLKEAIKFLLHNCFFSIENIIMIQVIGIPMGHDPAQFFTNLFLAHTEAY